VITKTVRIPYTRTNPKIHLYLPGDLHFGTVFCLEKEARAKFKEIAADPIGYWIDMGDDGEYITPDDPRWDASDKLTSSWVVRDDIAYSIENKIVEVQEPAASTCIGKILGNHENAYRRHKFGDVHQHICDKLKVDNLGFVCLIRFIFEREHSNEHHSMLGAFTHGASAAITDAGKKAALRRFMGYWPTADIFGYAHTHHLDNIEVVSLDVSEKRNDELKVVDKIQHGVLTGCYFKTYGDSTIPSYGEFKLYPPTRIGCPKFIINCHTGEIEPETIASV